MSMDMQSSIFTQMVLKANPSIRADFHSWMFHVGMLFDAPEKWWGGFGQRDFPHEGVDFCCFRDRSNHRHKLGTQTQIPVMFDGIVRAMFKDYLGQAIVVEHDISVSRGTSKGGLLTVYAHTRPVHGLAPDTQLNQGDIIATIASTHQSKANILPHLHLSVAIPAPGISFDSFVWNIMRDPARMILLNPMFL